MRLGIALRWTKASSYFARVVKSLPKFWLFCLCRNSSPALVQDLGLSRRDKAAGQDKGASAGTWDSSVVVQDQVHLSSAGGKGAAWLNAAGRRFRRFSWKTVDH